MMRFKFDANQEFQVEAVEAVVDLFQGQSRLTGELEFVGGKLSGLAAVANRLDLDDHFLLENLREVQERNGIKADSALKQIEEEIETPEGTTKARFLNFSVEMETGTGKTYVYLRTMHELFRDYGWRKFIIVVPSVAIREGVLKTLAITEDHFRALYDNPVCRYYRYDSANLTRSSRGARRLQ